MKLVAGILFAATVWAQRPSTLDVGPPPDDSRGGRVCLFETRGAGGNQKICLQAPPSLAADVLLVLPDSGDGVLSKSGSTMSWIPAGGVQSIGVQPPIQTTGGQNPTLSCPTCMRTDTTSIPGFGVNLGSTSNWFNAIYSGNFTVSTGPTCVNSVQITATNLFGGSLQVKDGACATAGEINNNGMNVTGVGSYRVSGITVIEPDRDLSNIKDISFTGTVLSGSVPWARITGAPTFLTSYNGIPPIQTSLFGSTLQISCTTCVRTDVAVNAGGVDLGTSSAWWNTVWAGSHTVRTSACVDSANLTGTAAFGGRVTVKNSSCGLSVDIDQNGVNVFGFSGYRVNGTTVIDTSRNLLNIGSITTTGLISTGLWFVANGQSGLTQTFTVMDDTGAPCSLTYNGGILTGKTCF